MSQPHHKSWELSDRIAAALTEVFKSYPPDLRCKIEINHFDVLPILPDTVAVTFRPPQRRNRKGV